MKYSLIIKTHFIIFLIAILTISSKTSLAHDDPSLPPGKISFEHFTSRDGLANGVIYDMAQDKEGFLWFSTANGITRFDGYRFKNYTPNKDKKHSISSGPAPNLYIDSKNRLWITIVNGGLHLYDKKKDLFKLFKHDPNDANSLASNTIYDIIEDNQGALWITSINAGLTRFDPENNQYKRFKHNPEDSDSLCSNRTFSIFQDSQNHLWIGTLKDGVCRYNPETKKFSRYLKGSKQILGIMEDQNKNIWISSMGGGLSRFNRKTNSFQTYKHNPKDPHSLSHNQVVQAYEDSKGTIWVTTWGGGVNIYNPNSDSFQSYKHDPYNLDGISSNNTYGIFEDRTGVIWIGTYGNGINKYDRKRERFPVLHKDKHHALGLSLNSNNIKAVIEDSEGFIWFGSREKGLNKFDPATKKFTYFLHKETNPKSLNSNNIWSLAEDQQKNIWVATGKGLNRFNRRDNKFERFSHDPDNSNSLSSNNLRSIYIDSKNQLWIGTQNSGVSRYNIKTKTFTHYPKAGVSIKSFFEDSQGNLFQGNALGLFLFDPENNAFKKFRLKPDQVDSEINTFVNSITEDINGNIWLGTTNGLTKLDLKEKSAVTYTQKDGLIYNDISGVITGNPDEIWISTTKGLSKMVISRELFTQYELDSFNTGAISKTKKGEIFIGSTHGVTHFFYGNISQNTHIPPVYLTSFKIFNKEIPHPIPLTEISELDLSYKDRFFSFEFSALDFSDPNKNRYQYKMEGFDRNWIEVDSSRRFASYTNLDGGNYTFRVKASNNDGIWNEDGISVKVNISHPVWELWWFRTLAALILASLLVSIYVIRVQKIKQQKETLTKQIEEKERIEVSLRESESRFRDLLNHASDAIYISNTEGKVIDVNRKASENMQFSRDELLGLNITEIDADFVAIEDAKAFWDSLIPGQTTTLLTTHKRKDGSTFPVELNCGKLDIQGETLMIGLARDITDRILAQQKTENLQSQLLQANKMEALGTLTAGVAHEINNPLSGISQNIQVIRNRLSVDNPPNNKAAKEVNTTIDSIREYAAKRDLFNFIENTMESCKQATRIIENMLSFSHKSEFTPVPTDLSVLLDKSIELLNKDFNLTTHFDFKKIILEKQYSKDLPHPLVDAGMIQQVFINILQNGAQAMSEVTSPSYQSKFLLNLYQQNENLKIEIRDNGPGMSEEVLQKIFEPFFTTKKVGSGTGLGLSISYFIISEVHHGDLEVQSTENEGTKFIISLPVSSRKL